MLKIDIEIDISAFEKDVDDHIARTFQPAVVEALNKAGEAGRDAVRKGMISAFDRPNPFTLAGVDIMKASVRTDGGDPPRGGRSQRLHRSSPADLGLTLHSETREG